jgi:hypothetical protein
VGVEIGSVLPDVAADLASGPLLRPMEKDIVLEDMDQTPCVGGFVFGADIDGQDGIEERNLLFLYEIDFKPVVQGEMLGWGFST